MSDNQSLAVPASGIVTHYKMNHPRRGMALIFNHEFYEGEYASRRTGTNVDCQNLAHCLIELGFEVKDYQNLDLKDIQETLKKVSETDHEDHDCLVVAVFTHGDVGKLYAHDTTYKIDTIWPYFTDKRCSSLAGKPKIFFIQACRGDQLDHGLSLKERTETDDSSTYCVPSHPDFLIAYSNIPGHYSWRNRLKGSWFIQALCWELSNNGREYHLLMLLTSVCQYVAIEHESHIPGNTRMDKKKQTPCFISTLTRLCQF